MMFAKRRVALVLAVITCLVMANTAYAAGTVVFTNPTSTNSTFNRTGAASYAKTWAAKPGNSTVYPTYGGVGGDCTNFVSQAMVGGGMQFQKDPSNWEAYDRNWYFYGANPPDRSYSWTGAHEFRHYWGMGPSYGGKHAYEMVIYTIAEAKANFSEIYNNLWKGDVVQHVDAGGTTYHSQVVVDYNGSDITVAQHSDDQGTWGTLSLQSYINARSSGQVIILKMKSGVI